MLTAFCALAIRLDYTHDLSNYKVYRKNQFLAINFRSEVTQIDSNCLIFFNNRLNLTNTVITKLSIE